MAVNSYMPMSDGTGKEIVQKLEDLCVLERMKMAGEALGDDAIVIKLLLDNNTPFEAWKIYANARKKDGWTLNKIVETWCAAVDDGKTYTTKIMRSDTSGGVDGLSMSTGLNSNKFDDNATLACLPSTASVEAVDDYVNVAGLLWLDCQYKIDETTLEPIIIAVEGVGDGVNYKPQDGSLIGVVQATYWREVIQNEEYDQFKFAFGQRGAGFKPMCASVRVDNTVRPYFIHAKWLLGYNEEHTKLYNGYMAIPAVGHADSSAGNYYAMSHNAGLNYMHTNYGEQYGLGEYELFSVFALDMLLWKYGVMGNSAIMAGNCSGEFYLNATMNEENVKRVVLSNGDANRVTIGMPVNLGTDKGYNNKGRFSIREWAIPTRKEAVDSSNTAIYFDNEEEGWDTQAGVTSLCGWHAYNGYTNSVKEKHDGTPVNNTNGREPFRLQGIQFLSGCYEIIGDTKLYANAGTTYFYQIPKCAERITSAATGNYKVSASYMADYADGKWNSIGVYEHGETAGVLKNANTSVYQRYRSSQLLYGTSTNDAWRELLTCGDLAAGGSAGVACVRGRGNLDSSYWGFAARPCGTSGNRGEWA